MSCSDLWCKASLPSTGLDTLTLLGVKDIYQLPWSWNMGPSKEPLQSLASLFSVWAHLPLVIPALFLRPQGLNRTDLWCCLTSAFLVQWAKPAFTPALFPQMLLTTRYEYLDLCMVTRHLVPPCLRSKRWSPSVIQPTMSCAGATSSNDL